jgi:predicted HicB family RNase H-like nuclease
MASMFIKDFPKDLHRTAKIQAAVEGVSLKDLVVKSLTEYLKRAGMEADQRKEE